eukprot:866188-Amphidinium_carterae.1
MERLQRPFFNNSAPHPLNNYLNISVTNCSQVGQSIHEFQTSRFNKQRPTLHIDLFWNKCLNESLGTCMSMSFDTRRTQLTCAITLQKPLQDLCRWRRSTRAKTQRELFDTIR